MLAVFVSSHPSIKAFVGNEVVTEKSSCKFHAKGKPLRARVNIIQKKLKIWWLLSYDNERLQGSSGLKFRNFRNKKYPDVLRIGKRLKTEFTAVLSANHILPSNLIFSWLQAHRYAVEWGGNSGSEYVHFQVNKKETKTSKEVNKWKIADIFSSEFNFPKLFTQEDNPSLILKWQF